MTPERFRLYRNSAIAMLAVCAIFGAYWYLVPEGTKLYDDADIASPERSTVTRDHDAVLQATAILPRVTVHVRGRVIDKVGSPLADASVAIEVPAAATRLHANLNAPRSLMSADDGAFDFLAPKGKYNAIIVAKLEGYEAQGQSISINDADVNGIEIILSRTAAISGTILDSRRRPMEYMVVEARTDSEGIRFRSESRPTAGDGAFIVSQLNGGSYTLHARYMPPGGRKDFKGGVPVEMPGLVGDAGPLKNVAVTEGEQLTGVELIVPWNESDTIYGVVVDEQNTPVPGAFVWAESGHKAGQAIGICTALSSADGRFQIRHMSHSNNDAALFFSIYARVEGYEEGVAEHVEIGERSVKIILMEARRGAISGQVVDADTGEPVASAKVELEQVACDWGERWNSPDYLNPHHDGRVSRSGRFSFDDVPAGVATLKVYDPLYGLSTIERIVVRSGETTEIQVVLTRCGQLEVDVQTVGDFEGAQFHDLNIDCWPLDRVGDPTVVSDFNVHEAIRGAPVSPKAESGGIRTMSLPPGQYGVAVRATPMLASNPLLVPADAFVYGEATVESGETTRIALKVGGTCSVSGCIVPREGESLSVSLTPGEGVTISVDADFTAAVRNASESGIFFWKRIQETGSFEFLGIPPGTYTATLSSMSAQQSATFVVSTQTVRLSDGDAEIVELR